MERTEILAQRIAQRSKIKDPKSQAFAETGARAAATIQSYLLRFASDAERVLEFGCASGRVLLPLSKLRPDVRFVGTDVDEEAIEYLSLVSASNVETRLNSYDGGLPFEDCSIDVVFAISVWSHFPEKLSTHWLAEVRRVLVPSGVAFISVGGLATLNHWRQNFQRWKEITEEDYENEQFVYREFINLHSDPQFYPGVTESWGNTLVHPNYIKVVWGRDFEVLTIDPAGSTGNQDMVVLRKPG
jgi:SAM-dependent methyltransferase